jgi:hypothetical protein
MRWFFVVMEQLLSMVTKSQDRTTNPYHLFAMTYAAMLQLDRFY